MHDQDQSREQLLEEVAALRSRVARLEAANGRPPTPFFLRALPAWVGTTLTILDDALFVLDREWRFLYLNPQAERQSREPPGALLGQVLWEKYPQLLGSPLEGHYRRAMAEQKPAHFEMAGLLSGRWLEVHAYPAPEALVVYTRDASERKRAQETLRQSEARLRQFFEATFEGLVIHAGGVILDVNQAACNLFGCTLAEMLGRSILDFTAPESRDEVRRRVQAGDERPYEAMGRRKDGSTFPGEVRGKATTFRNQPARVTAIRDLTERKRAEAELQASARRLQRLSHRLLAVQEEERRRLARELHDEVAQVLVGLNYTLELSSRAAGAGREAGLAQSRGMLRDLARQVRDISQLLRPSMLDDLGLQPALAWHCSRYTAQTGVRVAFECGGLGGRLPAAVETAAYRIVQEALTNVARHAGVDQAAVRVHLAPGRLRLEVEDRGAGFDPAAVRAAGAGGGLSGIQERVALLGGCLAVESAPGAGTRLTAELSVTAREEGGNHDVDPAAGR